MKSKIEAIKRLRIWLESYKTGDPILKDAKDFVEAVMDLGVRDYLADEEAKAMMTTIDKVNKL